MTTVAALELWEESIGLPPFRVIVFEHPKRKRTLYLRWRADGNWKYLSLSAAAARDGFDTATLSRADGEALAGRALNERKRWAREQARQAEAKLRLGMPVVETRRTTLTLKDAWALVSDPDTGKYPTETPHRNEVERELKNVCRILGDDTPWQSVGRAQLTKLWRTRIRELVGRSTTKRPITGLRGAEITVARLLAVAQWLRDMEHIPGDACIVSKTWKEELRRDWQAIAQADRVPEPNRPRHELEEFRNLLVASWSIDPRFGLLVALGAELRGGQVARARRSDIDLDANTFTVPGMGKKRGAVVHLTEGQRAGVYRALAGYLAPLEEARTRGDLADYYLFPAGQMPGGRSGKHRAEVQRHGVGGYAGPSALRKWMREAEKIAGIAHVKGRALYGLRRVSVDAGKDAGISREGLKELGGWTDTQVPDRIYAEQERKQARDEAAATRAKTRGEK